MHDELQPGERKPINLRNTAIVLGAIGGIWLLSDFDGINIGIPFGHEDHAAAAIVIDGDRPGTDKLEAIDNIGERIGAKIEAKINDHAGRAVPSANDAEMRAAIEELKAGKPDRYLKLMEKY